VCVVSVLAIASCASQGSAVGDTSDMAKVYLVQQGPVPGQSGNFWVGLDGTLVEKRPWGGTADDSATGMFFLAADEKNLYFRAEVQDVSPNLRPLDLEVAQAWNGTSLQFFFGTKTAKHPAYDEGDNNLSIWAVQEEDGSYGARVAMSGRLMNERQHKAAVVEWKEKSFIIEASFSFDSLSIFKPFKPGQKVRCEFRINQAALDSDRSYIINWKTPTDDAWHDPNVWSDGIVVQKP